MTSGNSTGLLTSGQTANLLGTTKETIREWTKRGKLKCIRTGHYSWRRYRVADIRKLLGEETESNDPTILAYVRCSGHAQAKNFRNDGDSDLKRQRDRVIEWCKEQFGMSPVIYSDIGSGLTYTRQGFSRLIQGILSGKYDGSKLIIENKERLVRFGYELCEQICNQHSIEIIIINRDEEISDSQELSEDLLSIIHVFSSRSYALRSAERNTHKLAANVVQRIKHLRSKGHSIARISRVLHRENHLTENGYPITFGVIKRHLKLFSTSESATLSTPIIECDSINKFIKEKIHFSDCQLRILKTELYKKYCEYCGELGIEPDNRGIVSRVLNREGFKQIKTRDSNGKSQWAYAGIKVDGAEQNRVGDRRAGKIQGSVAAGLKKQDKKYDIDCGNFKDFYWAELAGKYPGGITRKRINTLYKQYLGRNGLESVSQRLIAKIIYQLSGEMAQQTSIGMTYTFRADKTKTQTPQE